MKSLITFALILCLSGCATILSGQTQKVKFDANEGTRVTADGQACAAPCSMNLERGETHIAKFTAKSGRTKTVELDRTFNWVSAFNMLTIIGWLFDVSNGSMWNVSPDAVTVDMGSTAKEARPTKKTIR